MSEMPSRDHNVKARKAMINDACRRICSLEEQRKAISQDIAAVKQKTVKGDLGMQISDFNIALRVYRLEGDARTTLFDTLKECFAALNVGAQLTFLDAIGAEKTVVPEKPKRGRRRNPTPEQLGETVNKPHRPIDNIDEGRAVGGTGGVPLMREANGSENESPDDATSENDEEGEFGESVDGDDELPDLPESLDRRDEAIEEAV